MRARDAWTAAARRRCATILPVLRCEGVVKRYGRGGPPVLAGIDLALHGGDGLRVGGANGSGKSTLLRLVAGVSRPNSGRIERDAAAVGWAPTDPIGGATVSARAVLDAGRRVHGARRAVPIEPLIDVLGLGPHLDAPLRTRSAGTRRKVNVVFALLAPDPALLVLDEPFTTLDEPSSRALASTLTERRAAGSAVVVSDHGVAEGLLDGFASVVIEQGRARAGGVPTVARTRIDAERDGDHRSFTVDRAQSDAFLTELLHDGWSIVRVEPA